MEKKEELMISFNEAIFSQSPTLFLFIEGNINNNQKKTQTLMNNSI